MSITAQQATSIAHERTKPCASNSTGLPFIPTQHSPRNITATPHSSLSLIITSRNTEHLKAPDLFDARLMLGDNRATFAAWMQESASTFMSGPIALLTLPAAQSNLQAPAHLLVSGVHLSKIRLISPYD
jgi:hypothetical protein